MGCAACSPTRRSGGGWAKPGGRESRRSFAGTRSCGSWKPPTSPAAGYNDAMLTVAECVYIACVLEATARKPGNVHRFQDFDDLTYLDFLLSASAVAPILGK